MSDPPNPQVRQELYDGRLSQARQRENTHAHKHLTLDSDSHLPCESELISRVTGENRRRGPMFGPIREQNLRPVDGELNVICLNTLLKTKKDFHLQKNLIDFLSPSFQWSLGCC